MEKGKLLGKGMTAEVFEWGQDKVLKLYFEKFDDDWIKHEEEIGNILHVAGVPSPAIFGMISLLERKGLIFQRMSGKTMLKILGIEPLKQYYFAQRMAELHYKIHQYSAADLPSQGKRFAYMLNRSSSILGDKERRILAYIEKLPDGNSVCHGDLHFNNILVSPNNDLTAIDWNGAYKGCPLSDVARTCLILSSPAVPSGVSDFVNILSQSVKWITYWTYLSEYMRLAKVSFESIDKWILPVAAAKLKDKIHGEKNWLMGIINNRLT